MLVKALVVGGGGGGSSGGGGAGGVVENDSILLPAGIYQINIGLGGLPGNGNNIVGINGLPSSFYTLTAVGGGGGGKVETSPAPSGGCGGGVGATGSISNALGGTGSQGGNGGGNPSNFLSSPFAAGGGGGGGGNGASITSNSVGSAGGIGFLSSITGVPTRYGGGGGGGVYSGGTGGAGGAGGGGAGSGSGAGSNGTPNSGGGGGGTINGNIGGIGGSGIVIISCPAQVQNTPNLILGQVATRCFLPDATQASTTGWNSVTAHYARDNITALAVADVNWRAASFTGETNAGGTQTITRSVEYPIGTFTQMTWLGASSVTIADGNTAWTDFVNVTIPNGALFLLHKYQVNSVNLLSCTPFTDATLNPGLGEGINNSNIDQTMGGFVASGTQMMLPTPAVIALTTKPSIAALGSSRMIGAGDTALATSNDSGYARMFGPSFAYMNYGISGDTMNAVANLGLKRLVLAGYCTHLWIDPGLNDIHGGTAASVVLSYISTIAARWSALSKIIVNTEAAWTTSTDGWVTTVNQSTLTSPAGFETQRVALNTGILALVGYNQLVDANAFDGNGTNFQYWNNAAVGGYKFTADGTHETTAALVNMAISGIFNPALVTNP